MRLLLDTHALLWFYEGSSMLSTSARQAMEDSTNQCYVSHASAWEIAIKVSLRKLKLDVEFGELFPKTVISSGFRILDPKLAHYEELLTLPFHHRDPFDRLIIAQGRREGMAIVTCDPEFSAYSVALFW